MKPDLHNKRYFELAEKWMNGTITSDEEKEYAQWYNSDQNMPIELPKSFVHTSAEHQKRMMEGLNHKSGIHLNTRVFFIRRIAAAASILLFVSIGLYVYLHTKNNITKNTLYVLNDIAPGRNKAVLTLANGKQIILNDARNGQLADESNTLINKTADGHVVYKKATVGKTAMVFNTLSTPRGGQYTLILADGTRVLLNAASSITYPTSFLGNERKVVLTGEAYFEVAHNASKPFRVTSQEQTVEVLGTHFNINAYSDESYIRTTLVEGSVKVSSGTSKEIIKPGQQAILMQQSIKVKDADIEETIAWTNGFFRFNDAKIESVMRILSRWYDIDVAYEGKVTDEGFYGKISRYKNISQVLKMLEKTKVVHFKVEGRRVTLMQ